MSEQEDHGARFAREIAANVEKVFKATQLIANTRDEEGDITIIYPCSQYG